MWKMMVKVIMPLVVLLGTTGCGTTRPSSTPSKEEQQEVPSIEGVHYATIVFDEGKTSLKKTNKKNLHNLVRKAEKQKAPIEEIRILAWADNEYPDKVTGKTSRKDVEMASQRGLAIKDFLEKELKDADDIDSYNMAKRPDLLSKLLRDDEYQVKEAFESSGATATKLPDGSVSYTKASKAIVIIDYEGQ